MKKFSSLAYAYHQWQLAVDFDHNINETAKYIWSIPQAALDQWKTELDDLRDRFTTHVYDIYQNMFEVGKMLMGFTIGCNSVDDYVRLYKLSESTISWRFTNVLCSTTINILDMNGISRSITLPKGETAELPIVIKPKSLTVDGDIFDLIDSRHNILGICNGHEYELRVRDHNRLGEESWYASINYAEGDFHLVRSHTTNEKKFVDYYNYLIKMLNSISTRTVTSGTGASATTSTMTTISYYPDKSLIKPYNYLNVSGTVNVVHAPAETVLEFNIYE